VVEEDALLLKEQRFLLDFAHSKEWKNLMIMNAILFVVSIVQNIWLMTIDFESYLNVSISNSAVSFLYLFLLITGSILSLMFPLALVLSYIGSSKENLKLVQLAIKFAKAYLLVQMLVVIVTIGSTIVLGVFLLFKVFITAIILLLAIGVFTYPLYKVFSMALYLLDNLSNRLNGSKDGLKPIDDFVKFYTVYLIILIITLIGQVVSLFSSLINRDLGFDWALAARIDSIALLGSVLSLLVAIYTRFVLQTFNGKYLNLGSSAIRRDKD